MSMAADLAGSQRGPSLWHPRQPEGTPLYRLLESRYEPVKQAWKDRFEDRYGFWRGMVDGAVARYLDCGIFENGFARLHCDGCRRDVLVAFSCKGRGLCPSCGAKRGAAAAARLREEVLEAVGHAQWGCHDKEGEGAPNGRPIFGRPCVSRTHGRTPGAPQLTQHELFTTKPRLAAQLPL